MSHNNQFMIMMTLLFSSGTVMAHIGDHHAMSLGTLITHLLTQPVHLLWLLPLALMIISFVIARTKTLAKRKD